MKHHMQLRVRTPLNKNPPQVHKPQKQRANNKLLVSLKELFGKNPGAEIYEQARKHNIKYIEEIEEKGFEITCVNQKLVLMKKNDSLLQSGQKEVIMQSEFERNYEENINKYKEQVYYDLFFNNLKDQEGQSIKKRKRITKKRKKPESITNTLTKKNQEKQNQQKDQNSANKDNNSPCFTSEPESPNLEEQFQNLYSFGESGDDESEDENGDNFEEYRRLENSKQGTPIIRSFDQINSSQMEEQDNEKNENDLYCNTECLSENKSHRSSFIEKPQIQEFHVSSPIKIDKVDQKLNKNPKNKKKKIKDDSSYTVSHINSFDEGEDSDFRVRQNSTKFNRYKKSFSNINKNPNLKRIGYSSPTQSQVSQKSHSSIKQQQEQSLLQEKKIMSSLSQTLESLKLDEKQDEQEMDQETKREQDIAQFNSVYSNINIFESYDHLFLKLKEEFFQKKLKQNESEIIPITHPPYDKDRFSLQYMSTEGSSQQNTQPLYSPISKLIPTPPYLPKQPLNHRPLPKKLKSKVTKKYPSINHVLRKDNFSQNVRIEFNQPLRIFNAPNWFGNN